MSIRFVPLLILLSACAPGPNPAPDPGPAPFPAGPGGGDDSCGALQHAGLVGQDATALERVLLMGQVRVIRPGMAVTMDYSPTRTNFEIDAANRIARVSCG